MNYENDYYAILGLEPNATAEQIKSAYRSLCKIHHPDVKGDAAMMKLLNKAYTILSDPEQRMQYNKTYSTNNTLFHQSSSPSDIIQGYVLLNDGTVEIKEFSTTSFNFSIEPYIDNTGYIYIYDNKVIDAFYWQNLYYYYVYPQADIQVFAHNKKGRIFVSTKQISEISFSFLRYITPSKELFVKTTKDTGIFAYNSRYDFDYAISNIRERQKTHIKYSVMIAAILFFISFIIYDSLLNSPSPSDYDTSSETTVTNLIEYTPPVHGKESYIYTESKNTSTIEFKTSPSDDNYYYIKAVKEGKLIQAAFIHSGQSYEMILPVGCYQIYYATGNVWYGAIDLFGPEGSYAVCDSTFELTYNTGYTLTLYKVYNGNMTTDTISYADFMNA